MLIELKGKPLSTNNIYRSVCRGKFPSVYMSAAGKALKEDYQWQIKEQIRGNVVMVDDLKIAITLFHGTKRKMDWDNFHKISMDAMTGLVYQDDSQIRMATVMQSYDKDDPRIVIDIRPL